MSAQEGRSLPTAPLLSWEITPKSDPFYWDLAGVTGVLS